MFDVVTYRLQQVERFLNTSGARLTAFFAVLLAVTFVLRLWQYGWAVNDDGALYLYAAKNFIDQGAMAAFQTYEWAYYSIVVAYVDMLFFNNLVISGWVLNFLLQTGQIYFLYKICKAFHLQKPRLFWVLVLFIISISFHNFRNYLMRDQGYILCVMAGVYFSLVFLDKKNTASLLLFFVSFILAALFRIEAFLLLVVGFAAITVLTKEYAMSMIAATIALILLAISLLVLSNISSVDFAGHFLRKFPDMAAHFSNQQEILESQLLPKHWHDYSGASLFGLFFFSYIIYLLNSISIYLLAYFYIGKVQFNPAKILLAVYALTVVFYCLAFLFSRSFLVFRYNLPLTYLLTTVAIVLVLSASARRARLARAVLVLFIAVSLVKVMDAPSGSKRYLLEAQGFVETMGLEGSQVQSNTLQISLINGVDFNSAMKFKNRLYLLPANLKKPLKPEVAVVYYGKVSQELEISDSNCLVYQKKHRSRLISVYTAKNEYCLSGET
ncbi:hypothetical protein [Oceanicoccus sagamiensis]|uniref:Glycosyltransferase RgtA/B/C/D-like domain-containing protein n=1 Tax=Oceanicoccus sagamiensis TaxID=716816 RepID=A0A1X9N715_9GAMM|nr:hypothetical protein [Oceanicoccus sagamiensis]ARN73890.1 hypothetical protein BST96_07040 [Oceanicoccus sagamiensis]